MTNRLHIIWQAKGNNDLQKIQNSFIKHTSKKFKELLEKDNNLKAYEVNTIDRKYNFFGYRLVSPPTEIHLSYNHLPFITNRLTSIQIVSAYTKII